MATAQQKMTVGEKLEKALEFKDVGNTAYKEGNYKVAAKNYHKAILYLKVTLRLLLFVKKLHKHLENCSASRCLDKTYMQFQGRSREEYFF